MQLTVSDESAARESRGEVGGKGDWKRQGPRVPAAQGGKRLRLHSWSPGASPKPAPAHASTAKAEARFILRKLKARRETAFLSQRSFIGAGLVPSPASCLRPHPVFPCLWIPLELSDFS